MRYIPGTQIGLAEIQTLSDDEVWCLAVFMGADVDPNQPREACIAFLRNILQLT